MLLAKLIAHRGASGYARENTMAAFIKATALNANCFEVDIQITKDNIPVVFHDSDLLRMYQLPQLIAEIGLSELQQLTNNEIVTLEQLLQYAKKCNITLNLELKTFKDNSNALINSVLTVLQHYSKVNVVFSSFTVAAISLLSNSKYKYGLALDSLTEIKEKLPLIKPDFLVMNHEILTSKLLTELFVNYPEIYAYTVNTKQRLIELHNLGVSGVFTDYLSELSDAE